MTITIRNKIDYFNTAIEVAQLANGQKAEFERIFEERNRMQQEKLFELMGDCFSQTIYEKKIFPCERSRQAVCKVCSSGCLQDFLGLLKGISYGWKPNATDVQLDNTTTSNSEDIEKMQESLDLHGKIQTNTSYNDQLATQLPPEECYTMEEQPAYATYPIGMFILEKGINDNKVSSISRKRSVLCFTLYYLPLYNRLVLMNT